MDCCVFDNAHVSDPNGPSGHATSGRNDDVTHYFLRQHFLDGSHARVESFDESNEELYSRLSRRTHESVSGPLLTSHGFLNEKVCPIRSLTNRPSDESAWVYKQ